MTHFETAPLADNLPFGAIVSGLEFEDLRDTETRRRLRDLWIREGVLVFRSIEGESAHLELSRCFGKLMVHPSKEAHTANPEIIDLRYKPDTGWLMSVDGNLRCSWLPWHSDLVFVDRINRGGILRPIVLPSHLGQTAFIDKIAAYSALPDKLKKSVEDRHVIYKFDLDPAHQKFGRLAKVVVERFDQVTAGVQARLHEFPRVLHPMVYSQPETGRKVLNVSPWFAVGIFGMENEEGDRLLEEVVQHIVHSDHVYQHTWQLGDMVLWDNWRMLHSASGSPANEERWMQRTTIEGDYGLGRTEADMSIDRSRYISV
jgi:taurine dioxygenase